MNKALVFFTMLTLAIPVAASAQSPAASPDAMHGQMKHGSAMSHNKKMSHDAKMMHVSKMAHGAAMSHDSKMMHDGKKKPTPSAT